MRIAVAAANGKAGRLIVQEAVNRGMDVTAIVRGENKSAAQNAIVKVSPAAEFNADGERTGKYILAGEEYTTNSKGESIISYADYAIAIVDEIENAAHVRERISVLGE